MGVTNPDKTLPVVVDFDNTLALGNTGNIETLAPNRPLIERLKRIRKDINPLIKIVTARGGQAGLTYEQKEQKYIGPLTAWLKKYEVPYDLISFNKEYGKLYIDDQTIGEHSDFFGTQSEFTGNKLIFTESTVIKRCNTSLFEQEWYRVAERHDIAAPAVRFANSECLILERIKGYTKPLSSNFIEVLRKFEQIKEIRYTDDYQTYIENIGDPAQYPGITPAACRVVESLKDLEHKSTFFHGDLSTTNVLCVDGTPFLIDPNVKHIFGSYLTDAGKAAFSLIAYEAQWQEAEKIAARFGPAVWRYAVAEGLRVCKYQAKYISIVNNIADFTENA